MAEDDLAPAIRAKARAEAFREAADMLWNDAKRYHDQAWPVTAYALESAALKLRKAAEDAHA